MTDATTTSTAQDWPELSFDELVDSFREVEEKLDAMPLPLVRIEMSPDVYDQVIAGIKSENASLPRPLLRGVVMRKVGLFPPGTFLPVYRNRDGTETYGLTKDGLAKVGNANE